MLDKQRIILPQRLRQALSLDDWRPLIASSLLNLAWARARRRRILGSWLVITAVIYTALALFAIFVPSLQSQTVTSAEVIVGSFAWLLALVVVGLINSPKTHKEVFDADRQVAGLMGKSTFLGTLGKLENLAEEFSSPTRRLDRYRAPTIKERIDNLSRLNG